MNSDICGCFEVVSATLLLVKPLLQDPFAQAWIDTPAQVPTGYACGCIPARQDKRQLHQAHHGQYRCRDYVLPARLDGQNACMRPEHNGHNSKRLVIFERNVGETPLGRTKLMINPITPPEAFSAV